MVGAAVVGPAVDAAVAVTAAVVVGFSVVVGAAVDGFTMVVGAAVDGRSVGFSFVVTSVSLVVPEDSIGAVVNSSAPDEIIKEVKHSCDIFLFYFFS